ncbi:MAG: hypothetical protein HYT20_00205 [Candidatus Nealsonbacteria bacterium]|nr:hypothetical protein [Candidatus Nealsonbacteria bacterium]
MTNNTITIPKEMTRGEELLIVPRKKFEEFLRWQKRREWEEKDTDEAIRIFKNELKNGKLKLARNFAEILKKAKEHAK